jgi:hypothetical protein
LEQLRSIHIDEDYLFTPLHRDLGAGDELRVEPSSSGYFAVFQSEPNAV